MPPVKKEPTLYHLCMPVKWVYALLSSKIFDLSGH
jgi:hypothetical protein